MLPLKSVILPMELVYAFPSLYPGFFLWNTLHQRDRGTAPASAGAFLHPRTDAARRRTAGALQSGCAAAVFANRSCTLSAKNNLVLHRLYPGIGSAFINRTSVLSRDAFPFISSGCIGRWSVCRSTEKHSACIPWLRKPAAD